MIHKNDQKVCVAYLHPSDVSAKFMRSFVFMLAVDSKGVKTPDGKIGGRNRIFDGGAYMPVQSGAQITKSRNRVVRDFLELEGIDWLLMLDADMTFDPDLIERLVDAAHPTLRPIVGGLCFAYMAGQSRQVWPTLYAHVPGSERLRRLVTYPQDTLIPVGATGAACLLVHRSVLEGMRDARLPDGQPRFKPPFVWFDETKFVEKENGVPVWETADVYSEDITFCLRAQACGFPVHVHTGVRLGHDKDMVVDEDMFLAESASLAEACVPALPTYAVIASKDRPEMLANLRAQLAGQVTETFVFDNGYREPPEGSICAHGEPLHAMWNGGLNLAAAANRGPFNVLVINDDVEVPTDFCARLEAGLRSHPDNWIAYPDVEGRVQPGEVAAVESKVRSLTGWAFMLRGESGLRFDEQFQWWYGDADIERQVAAAGKRTVTVGGCVARHLDPLRSTMDNPDRLAQAEADEQRFAEKWGIDPSSLWLAQNRQPA